MTDIAPLFSLPREQTVCVHAETEGGLRLEVRDYDNLRWLEIEGDAIQSLMRLDAPAEPVLPVTRAMLAALLLGGVPGSVLNLGLGGGAIERFFAAHFAGVEMTSVERSAAVIRIARDRFGLAPDTRVEQTDAASFLAGATAVFDLVFCDIFAGERHPACLADTRFYEDLRGVLAPGGAAALNLSPSSQDELDDPPVVPGRITDRHPGTRQRRAVGGHAATGQRRADPPRTAGA